MSTRYQWVFCIAFITAAFALLTPASSLACACGCGVFDVQTGSMLPTQPGGMAFIEYDWMNQNHNWHASSNSSPVNNSDKDIRTSFFTAGAQYMFNRAWGAEIEVPYWQRHFTTTGNSGTISNFDHAAVGDMRIRGIYSGFSKSMSSGITFGLKLPTGDYSYHGFDRDTAIGTGSTDMLLGGYRMGNLAGAWNWFANGEIDQPVLTIAGYRPGSEADATAGVYYNDWTIGRVKIAPIAQIIGSYRLHDRGASANPDNSGYQRLLLAPGLELDTGNIRLYGDVGFPVYQHVKGNQLVASELFKLNVSYRF